MNREPTEMELRVARALIFDSPRSPYFGAHGKDLVSVEASSGDFQNALVYARFAIHAMREPTEEMVVLGSHCADACLSDPCGKLSKHVYATMIDAASPPEKT